MSRKDLFQEGQKWPTQRQREIGHLVEIEIVVIDLDLEIDIVLEVEKGPLLRKRSSF